MRKILAIGLLTVALMLGGCESESGSLFIGYYVDPETGVNYVEYANTRGGGICPRYNADGSLYVSEVGK